eukprot:1829832-Alexandrium_andersonii.AAC.1
MRGAQASVHPTQSHTHRPSQLPRKDAWWMHEACFEAGRCCRLQAGGADCCVFCEWCIRCTFRRARMLPL